MPCAASGGSLSGGWMDGSRSSPRSRHLSTGALRRLTCGPRVRRQVHVLDGHHLPRRELDEHVEAVRVGRIDERVLRRIDRGGVAPVRVAGGLPGPVLASASSMATTSAPLFRMASTTLSKLTCTPPYSMLNSMTLSVAGDAEGVGEASLRIRRAARGEREAQERGRDEQPSRRAAPLAASCAASAHARTSPVVACPTLRAWPHDTSREAARQRAILRQTERGAPPYRSRPARRRRPLRRWRSARGSARPPPA